MAASTVYAAVGTGISYWDAAILAAAGALGSETVYSEDLNAGQQYARVQVINPFV